MQSPSRSRAARSRSQPHGLQRMTARVLAALLFTEQPTLTMGELAEQLRASPGAISAATKMLTSVGLAERVPAPGSRRDHYRLRDDAWAVSIHESERGDAPPCSWRPKPASAQRNPAASPTNASPICATSTISCSRRSLRFWIAGINALTGRRSGPAANRRTVSAAHEIVERQSIVDAPPNRCGRASSRRRASTTNCGRG